MARRDVSLDADLFSRTASLFALKRAALPPEAVETLAKDIVRRLAQKRHRRPAFELTEVDPAEVEAFCDALILPSPDPALRFIEDRRAEGVTRESVYLGYITAAARCLGERWDADRLSFLQVTCGTGHLYALMRAMRAEGPQARPGLDARRCAMFATVPGEDHGLGVSVAADLFREVGWDIDLRLGDDHVALVTHAEQTGPQIIGLSLSTDRGLDPLVRLVVALRIILPQSIIGVAPGQRLDPRQVRRLVDIDLVFGDARSACLELDRLVALRN